MDMNPRVLVWNYGDAEIVAVRDFLGQLEAPALQVVYPGEAGCTVNDLLAGHEAVTDEVAADVSAGNEKVMLFFNVEPRMVKLVMQQSRERELPRPIYAMVTDQNITWSFACLVEHLVEEHEFIRRRQAEERRRGGCEN